MTRKWPLALITAAGLLLAATGCSKVTPSPGKAQASSVSDDMTVVKVAYEPASPETLVLDLLIAAFQQQHPEYRVEKVSLGSGPDTINKLEELAQSGGADVIPVTNRTQMVKWLQPLDPHIGRSAMNLGSMGSLPELLRMDGVLYELPYSLRSTMLVYNPQLFEAAGVSIPTDRWSWDEFREAVSKVTAGRPDQRVWGFETNHYEYLARAYVEEKTGKPVWQADPEVVGEALRFFAGMVFTDQSMAKDKPVQIARSGQASLSYSRMPLYTLDQGQAAMTLEERLLLGTVSSMIRVPWNIAPMPTSGSGAPVSIAEPASFAISWKSQQVQGAWEFVRFAAGAEGARVIAAAGFQPVYVSEEVQAAWEAQSGQFPSGVSSLWDTKWVLPRMMNNRDQNYVLLMFHRAVNQTLSGAKTWEEALAEYREDVTPYLP